ncbi:MAG TPA: hypothetical protein PKA64_08170 [Myxococcota bacterium]|nr:hypothetical protein [Myxococcota bacterium]
MVPLLLTATLASAVEPVEIAHVEGANIQRPLWAPDGSQLSWEANYHEQQVIDLFLGDPETRRFQRVGSTQLAASALTAGFQTAGRYGHVVSDITFSPPSLARIVYTASDVQRDLDLHLEGLGAIAHAPGADGGAAWSPDGGWIAFTSSRTGEGDIYLIDTSAWSAGPVRLTREEEAAELYAAWSPDSRAIVYVARGHEGDHLWRIERGGGTPRQITAWPGSQILPRYSPVDRQIAFYANAERKDRFDLYIIADDPAAAPIRLAEDVVPNSTGPAWTPDGRAIVYTSRDDLAYNPLYVVPIDYPPARKAITLDTVGHGDVAVAPSPHGGLRVAYVAQGRATERNLTFKRLYMAELGPL